MKVTLEFGDEEQEEFFRAVHASEMFTVMWELENTLRNWLKYENHNFKTPDEALDGVRDTLNRLLTDNNLEIGR